ncbi:MAG: class I SAM-dependent methyltransferase [Desulfobacterales bacterium]|nr:class I SAM-dependent methyltransferase [Desulfobacterales bacterium]
MLPEIDNKTYFSRIHEEYRKASALADEFYQNIGAELKKKLYGVVVDFGNGGIINYPIENIDKLICIDIIYKNTTITDNKVDYRYGDFYDITFREEIDCLLAQFLFHHLVDDEKLKSSIRKIRGKLKRNGKIIILEIVLPRFAELIQNILKPIILNTLAIMRKPSLRFFSSRTLVELLAEAGYKDIQTQEIEMSVDKRLSPAPVLFPKMRIPGKMYPLKCILIEANP